MSEYDFVLHASPADKLQHVAANEAASKLRAPKVAELAHELVSSQTYLENNEPLPEDRKSETVDSLIAGIKAIYIIDDLLDLPNVQGSPELVAKLQLRKEEITNPAEPSTKITDADFIGKEKAAELG